MAVGTKSYDTNFRETKDSTVNNTNEDMMMIELNGLTPGTMYEITAYAVNGAGRGETATTEGTTLNGTANFLPNFTPCTNSVSIRDLDLALSPGPFP